MAELCVVGDADQSIYAFRGATIRNILQFEEDYPQARTILLEQNYRSTQTILSAANAVIERNAGRRAKNLWTESGEGPVIIGYAADQEHDEAQYVADEIDRLTDAGDARPGDVAVFYRTNAQSRVFEEVFIRVGLPYKVVGGVRFYERREVRDVLAYLRVLANPEDSVPLRRILNVPKRGIGDRAEAMIDALSQRERISFPQALRRVDDAYGMAARSANAVKRFNTLMDGCARSSSRAPGPRWCWKRCWNGPAISPSCRRRPIRRTRPGSRTFRNSPRWHWSSSRSAARRSRARWPSSWSGSRSSPTRTRSRTTTRSPAV